MSSSIPPGTINYICQSVTQILQILAEHQQLLERLCRRFDAIEKFKFTPIDTLQKFYDLEEKLSADKHLVNNMVSLRYQNST